MRGVVRGRSVSLSKVFLLAVWIAAGIATIAMHSSADAATPRVRKHRHRPTVTPTPKPTPTLTRTPTPTPKPTATPTPVMPAKAKDVLDSMGVGTKIVQGDSEVTTAAGLQYLGLSLVRDDATHDGAKMQALCDLHATTGAVVDPLPVVDTPGSNLAATQTYWDTLAACGALGYVEGPNEPNNFPFTNDTNQPCNGTTYAGCPAYMQALYSLVHTDANLPVGLRLWGMTDVGNEELDYGLQFLTVPAGAGTLNDGAVFADVANTHDYYQCNGSMSQAPLLDNHARIALTIQGGLCDAIGEYWGNTWAKNFPGASTGQNDRPKVITETGWNVFKPGAGISRDQQGKLITDGWLDAYQLGWLKTIVYELFERPPNDAGYGFLNADEAIPFDNTPTLMGVYTHNLTTILADNSSAFSRRR
jgi:hypothetical protein